MQKPIQHIGVDLAKNELVAALPGGVASFANSPAGLPALFARLPENAWVVCEATGGYERPLVDACHARGVPVSVANPRRVRAFARSQGILAKTDRIDAPLIGRYARHTETLREHRAPGAAEQALRELYQARETLVERLKQESVQAGHAPAARTDAGRLIARQAAARRRLLEKQVAELEAAMTGLIAATPALAARARRCAQVHGIGPVTLAAVLALMPELGALGKGQAAALLGVAPPPNQSGASDKPRHIEGGRARLRKALYMAALCAARCNPVLRPLYLRLRARGKPVKVALTALMRKLIELLNLLLKYPNFSLVLTTP